MYPYYKFLFKASKVQLILQISRVKTFLKSEDFWMVWHELTIDLQILM